MHPQLESQRFHYFSACLDLIEALDKCHQAEYYKRALGLCNNEKEALSKCLHQARYEVGKAAILENRKKQKVVEAKWKQIREEEYGEDAILKRIIQEQVAKKQKEQAKENK